MGFRVGSASGRSVQRAQQAKCAAQRGLRGLSKLGYQISRFVVVESGEGPVLQCPKCSTKSNHSKGSGRLGIQAVLKSWISTPGRVRGQRQPRGEDHGVKPSGGGSRGQQGQVEETLRHPLPTGLGWRPSVGAPHRPPLCSTIAVGLVTDLSACYEGELLDCGLFVPSDSAEKGEDENHKIH